jgi:hypothetical protein
MIVQQLADDVKLTVRFGGGADRLAVSHEDARNPSSNPNQRTKSSDQLTLSTASGATHDDGCELQKVSR